MYYCLYKVTNNINNKIYIGIHSTNNLNDGYIGSGTNILRAIKKYGRKNFTKKILYMFNSESEMILKECEIVTKDFCRRPDTYNIMPGGKFGSEKRNGLTFRGRNHTTETKERIRQAASGRKLSPETINKIKENNKRTNVSRGKKVSQKLRGRKKSRAHRLKLSNAASKHSNIFNLVDRKGNEFLINNLKLWCENNGLEYYKVYSYIGKGKIKMIERYRSKTREWFLGCSIDRV